MIVLDASIVVAWYLEPSNATASAVADSLAESGAVVPGNFHTEVAQALLRAERLALFATDDMLRATEDMLGLPVAVKLPPFSVIVAMARRHHLSAYDGAYLALAVDSGAPLATLDAKLASAAKSEKLLWASKTRRPRRRV